jgi:hypothetical protein
MTRGAILTRGPFGLPAATRPTLSELKEVLEGLGAPRSQALLRAFQAFPSEAATLSRPRMSDASRARTMSATQTT